jgi:hypothetical protein
VSKNSRGSCSTGTSGAVVPTLSNDTAAGSQVERPFWTCDTTPQKRNVEGARRVASAIRGLCAPEVRAPLPAWSRANVLVQSCIDLIASTLDISAEIPDSELASVSLDTKEQRLHWRDVLNEAVSQHHASALFTAYDIESSPPRYARPPLSSRPPAVVTPRSNRGTPHIIAPRGAGWSPLHLIGAVPNRTTCQRGLSGWWFGGSLPTATCDVLSLLSGRLPAPSRPSPGLPSMRDQMVDIRRRDAVEDSEAGNAAPSNASGRFHS